MAELRIQPDYHLPITVHPEVFHSSHTNDYKRIVILSTTSLYSHELIIQNCYRQTRKQVLEDFCPCCGGKLTDHYEARTLETPSRNTLKLYGISDMCVCVCEQCVVKAASGRHVRSAV